MTGLVALARCIVNVRTWISADQVNHSSTYLKGSRGYTCKWRSLLLNSLLYFNITLTGIVYKTALPSAILLALCSRSSMRTVTLYDVNTQSPLSEITVNISPATLIPFFDVDTKLLFLTGKVILVISTFCSFVDITLYREMAAFLPMSM